MQYSEIKRVQIDQIPQRSDQRRRQPYRHVFLRFKLEPRVFVCDGRDAEDRKDRKEDLRGDRVPKRRGETGSMGLERIKEAVESSARRQWQCVTRLCTHNLRTSKSSPVMMIS